MAKNFAKAFYKSKKWQNCRRSFIDERTLIDGGLCQICHKRLGYIVHHKIMLNASNINDASVSLNFDNLMFVCKDCHDNLPGHGVGNRETEKYFLMRAVKFFRLPPKKIHIRTITGPRGAGRNFAYLVYDPPPFFSEVT